MGLKSYKPTSPGLRLRTGYSFEEITMAEPAKALTTSLKHHAGRNNQGKVTTRHRGGGHKQLYRVLDFKRDKLGIVGIVASIEYDPNRTCRIALVNYQDGEKRYLLAPEGLHVGDKVQAGPGAEIKTGNALPMKLMPTGTLIHNLEPRPGQGGKLVRSAGNAAQLMAKEETYVLVRLPSGEIRRFRPDCYATIGQLGNADHKNVKLGKAGSSRHLGWRPTVRGKAMNPKDHPHGGGEGRNPIGMKHPKTPWGKPALGFKTRKNKVTSKFIVKRRK